MNECKIQNFDDDMKIEKQAAQFLDQYFYSGISADMDNFERVIDGERQYAGADLILNDTVVDEKVKNSDSPNKLENYYASLEIYQKYRDGQWAPGWFVNEKQLTDRYAFLYRFNDDYGNIEKTIMIMFGKTDMRNWLERNIGMKKLIDDAKDMEFAVKYIDDIRYYDSNRRKIGKLTKSKEGAAVFAFNLTDLEKICRTSILEITKKGTRRLDFEELRKYFSK